MLFTPCVDVVVNDIFTFRFVSFESKENTQRCGDVFFDILISSKGKRQVSPAQTMTTE